MRRRAVAVHATNGDIVRGGGWVAWSDDQLDYVRPGGSKGGVEWFQIEIPRVDDPMREWYASEIDAAAKATGTAGEVIRVRLRSRDVAQRASAYAMLLDYLGPSRFDAYATPLTAMAAQRRFAVAPTAGERRYFP